MLEECSSPSNMEAGGVATVAGWKTCREVPLPVCELLKKPLPVRLTKLSPKYLISVTSLTERKSFFQTF